MRRIGVRALAVTVSHLCIPFGVLTPLVSAAFVGSARAQTAPPPDPAPVVLPPVTVTSTSPVGGTTTNWNYGSFAFVNGAFVPVTVVDKREIDMNPSYTLGDILFTQPGITSSTFAPGASRPIIRGLDSSRVKVTESGIDAMDVSTLGEDHGVPVDPLSSQRIEVIRGPATLRYGSRAFGGVVNAENNRIPTELKKDEYRIGIQGAGTTVDGGLEGAVTMDARKGGFSAHADAFYRNAYNYIIPGGGYQDNSFVNTNGQSIGLSYSFDRGYIGTALTRFASHYGIPGGEEAQMLTNIAMEQVKWLTKGEFRPSSGLVEAVRLWTGVSWYHHAERGLPHQHEDEHEEEHEGEEEHEHEHAQEQPGYGQRVHGTFKSQAFEGRIEVQHVPFGTAIGTARGALGVQLNYENIFTTGEAREFLEPARTFSVASYLFEELEITPRTRVQAAGRIEFVKVNGYAADIPRSNLPPPDELSTTFAERTFVPINFSLGLLQDIPWNMTARVTAQYVERAPSALELFSKGSHHASGTFDIGNPNLGKEGAASFEIGLSRSEGDFRFDASAYVTHFRGFIYKQLTGITCDEAFASCGEPDGEFNQIVYRQRDANFYGAEVKAQYDVGPLAKGIWGIEGQYDFIHATFTDGTYVPRMPPHRLGGGLYWGDDSWSARVNLLHAFAQNDVAAFEPTTAGYNLLNAQLSYKRSLGFVGSNAVGLTVGVSATNLLDENIRNSASFKSQEVVLPGRNLRGFVKLTF
jgi:iron complex outermembrane receptor protein